MSEWIRCAVHDSAAELYEQPWYVLTKEMAIRHFVDLAGKPDNPVNRHPGDFNLMCLGMMDRVTGATVDLEQPLRLMTGFEARVAARKLFAENEREALALVRAQEEQNDAQ